MCRSVTCLVQRRLKEEARKRAPRQRGRVTPAPSSVRPRPSAGPHHRAASRTARRRRRRSRVAGGTVRRGDARPRVASACTRHGPRWTQRWGGATATTSARRGGHRSRRAAANGPLWRSWRRRRSRYRRRARCSAEPSSSRRRVRPPSRCQRARPSPSTVGEGGRAAAARAREASLHREPLWAQRASLRLPRSMALRRPRRGSRSFVPFREGSQTSARGSPGVPRRRMDGIACKNQEAVTDHLVGYPGGRATTKFVG